LAGTSSPTLLGIAHLLGLERKTHLAGLLGPGYSYYNWPLGILYILAWASLC